MFLLNLSIGEFLGLLSAAGGVVFALYLLDRSRRRVGVATLRFWTPAERPVESTRRRRIRQWPSLLLQLFSILCLLLAIAQLRLGTREDFSRDHVLILDTSSWMAARSGNSALIEQAKRQALAYVRAVPSSDRVMVVYADALATPATSFDSDRVALDRAIRLARPSHSALNLPQALSFARNVQRRTARRTGDIVFAGAGRIAAEDQGLNLDLPANLRVLPVAAPTENVGLRRIGLRRSTSEADLWQILVSVRNYGIRPQQVDLALQFAGAPAGLRRFRLGPASEQETVLDLRTRAAGLLEVRLRAASDSFSNDNRAVLELPRLPTVAVTLCSEGESLLRPLLDAHPNVVARYLPAASCPSSIDEGVAIFEGFAPANAVKASSIYVDPPSRNSPVSWKNQVSDTALTRWFPSHPVAAGVRTQDLKLSATSIFAPGSADIVIAESEQGPVIVAREFSAGRRSVVFGFNLMHPQLRYELAIPLVFANALRWTAPASFHRWEMYAERVGSVAVPLESDPAAGVRVITADGSPIPFAVHGSTLRFFSGQTGTVRVVTPGGEQVHSLVLPGVPETLWQPPASVKRGVPPSHAAPPLARDIWHWLALTGGLGLLLEWLWFAPALQHRRGSQGSGRRVLASNPVQEAVRRAS